jgi:hypothetical protein
MPRLVKFLTGALACSTVTVVLASTASATITTGNLIEPHTTKYVSGGDYGVRSDNFGSLTWLDNKGERGFRITRSTASGSRVTAYPNIFRGWQWGLTILTVGVTVPAAGGGRGGVGGTQGMQEGTRWHTGSAWV